MSTFIIQAERLDLVLEDPAEVLARIDALSPEDRKQVSPAWLALARATTAPDPWLHGFKAIDRATGAMVGSCGFKGPPTAERIVELAYGVNLEYQGCGYATESAIALVDFAFKDGMIRTVRAHTLAGDTASQCVLTKAGFELVGDVIDPEDGQVMRWERHNPMAEQCGQPEPLMMRDLKS
ncbi:MAG: GNAT family N-acetyltransferase [Planctomycetales bacterium]|nr:GNAT family N-acetyltransferase [Planctomycetales bacterium]